MTATSISAMPPVNDRAAAVSGQAVRGTLWAYLSFVSAKALAFISTIVLARLLVPEQFGLMAYGLIAIQYLDVLKSFGLDAALISRRDRVEEAANATFVISMTAGLLLFALAWVAAPSIADFFNEEGVTDLFRVLALVLPISAAATVPDAIIRRGLRFKARVIPDVGRSVLKGVLSVLLAWQGFGVWSLVWGQIAGEIVAAVMVWLIAGWRPTRVFDRRVTREMVFFGKHNLAIELMGALASSVDYLIVGRLLGAVSLGYYTLAYRIPDLVISYTNHVVGRVAHPVLAQVQDDRHAMRSIYLSYVRYISLFAFPAGVGLSVTAGPFIDVVLSAAWAPATNVMRWIPLAIAMSSVSYVPGIVYKAINRPQILNQLTAVKLPIMIGALWYGTRWGIEGVAVGRVAVAGLWVLVESVVVSRILAFPLRLTVAALMPALVGASVMGLGLLTIAASLPAGGAPGLGLLILVGIGLYVGTLALVSREAVTRVGSGLRASLTRS